MTLFAYYKAKIEMENLDITSKHLHQKSVKGPQCFANELSETRRRLAALMSTKKVGTRTKRLFDGVPTTLRHAHVTDLVNEALPPTLLQAVSGKRTKRRLDSEQGIAKLVLEAPVHSQHKVLLEFLSGNAPAHHAAAKPISSLSVFASMTLSPKKVEPPTKDLIAQALDGIPLDVLRWFAFHIHCACCSKALQVRRLRFQRELAATQSKLREHSIKLPLNFEKMALERSVQLSRDMAKHLFNTNIFLRQNPAVDLRQDILARRTKFQDDVDRTLNIVVVWETEFASQLLKRKPDLAPSREGSPASIGSRRRGKAPGSPASPRGPRFVVTHEAIAGRRHNRRASVVDPTKNASTATSARCTSLIDVRQILNTPYEGPIVREEFKAKRTQSSSAALGSTNSPSKASTRGSPQSLRKVTWREQAPWRTSSLPQLGENVDVVASIDLFDVDSLATSTMSPQNKRERPMKRQLPPLRGTASGIAAGAQKAHEPSVVISQLQEYEAQLLKGYKEQNASLKFWFDGSSKPSRLPLFRSTATTETRTVAPQVLSFFDDKGLIDGRRGNSEPHPRDGILYSEDRIVEVRRKAAEQEQKLARRLRKVTQLRNHAETTMESDATDGTVDKKAESGHGLLDYKAPNHSAANRVVPEPSADRLKELLSTVFVRGGEVSSFLRQMERETVGGEKRPDMRRSNKDRLGGSSVPRKAL